MLSEFTIKYPAINPGTDKMTIKFYEGQADLASLFKKRLNGEKMDESRGESLVERRRIFVTDKTVSSLKNVLPFINSFKNGTSGGDVLLVLEAGEKYKTMESVLKIIKTALDHRFVRHDVFVGIGGGVITDVTALAASLFKRGAVVEFVPTTLLAMVDAAVGGKTGCDFENYKNMIGSFYPAKTLYVFPHFVQTLSPNEFRSGFAEALKTALLYSPSMYELIKKSKSDILSRKEDVLFTIITECVKAKASVVESDFTEKNVRMQLNFGHTFGHALETVAGLGKVTHGDAVAWGIGRAACLSCNLKLCTSAYKDEILELLSSFGWETSALHSSVKNLQDPAQKLIDAMKNDKKNDSSSVRLILQRGIADTVITEVQDGDILKVLSSGK
ncbi:3-dehydroquinate synthase [Treponema parvum]|uniref:3-dehydroquinate synthase n=1 Tax=Treponema parvum TaxID=138851 RepID=A0A975F0E7_9SPIR|nr:3-dehydroquinate synthase family protein [Treponema parvum]QTQ12098.1 3-dehydroquinate synthase [Treponema parvum]